MNGNIQMSLFTISCERSGNITPCEQGFFLAWLFNKSFASFVSLTSNVNYSEILKAMLERNLCSQGNFESDMNTKMNMDTNRHYHIWRNDKNLLEYVLRELT